MRKGRILGSEQEFANSVARWEDSEHLGCVVPIIVPWRVQTGRDIHTPRDSRARSRRRSDPAGCAGGSAARTRQAPQREIARQKKEVEDTRVSQEKARIANKAAFRP